VLKDTTLLKYFERMCFILVESKGVMVGEVGAGDGGGLGVDLGVQALELARMTLKGARVDGDLGSVLVLHDERLSACSLRMLARAMAMSSRRAYMLGRVCGYLCFWVGGAVLIGKYFCYRFKNKLQCTTTKTKF
jgi:hypothetical protein